MFYEQGPERGADRLALSMAEWKRQGRISAADPKRAAQHFLALVQNRYFKARLCNYLPELTDAQIEAEVSEGVAAFLRAYGPPA
jgi:TetR/AcrR family transcriptional repressor of mexJK operon